MWLVKANDKFMQCLPMKVLVILQKIILALASTFVFLAMVIEVFVRYVLKSDLFGIEEVILAAVFYLYFFGGSLAGYEDSQIKADLISGALRNKPTMSIRDRNYGDWLPSAVFPLQCCLCRYL